MYVCMYLRDTYMHSCNSCIYDRESERASEREREREREREKLINPSRLNNCCRKSICTKTRRMNENCILNQNSSYPDSYFLAEETTIITKESIYLSIYLSNSLLQTVFLPLDCFPEKAK